MQQHAGLRKRLEREVGQRLPDYVWQDDDVQDMARGYVVATDESARQDEWEAMIDAATKRMRIVDQARAEALKGVSKGLGAALEEAPAHSRGSNEEEVSLAPGYSVSPRTATMLRAMCELFAGRAHQHPEVVAFREDVLGRLCSEDEAHALLASPAARTFPPEWFVEWGIPVIGHSASVEDQEATSSAQAFDHSVAIRVSPPGVTKKVRYADPRLQEDREGYRTRCMAQGGAPLPPVFNLGAEQHGDYWYPSWFWPGSIVAKLFDLSDELVTTFDWPAAGIGQLKKHLGAWFVLTGEAPDVRPIDARWQAKRGKRLRPQWRISLTVPPWLPPEEVLRAYALMRRRAFEGRIRVPDPKTLEAARFVWEQERLNGYERPGWPELLERWNETYPADTYKNYNNFRTVCLRGIRAILELNLSPPKL